MNRFMITVCALLALGMAACTTAQEQQAAPQVQQAPQNPQQLPDVKDIECETALEKVRNGAFLVDMRTAEEVSTGMLPGALNVPHDQIDARIKEFPADKGREIVVYCKSGRRSELGKAALKRNGYTNIVNAGGYASLVKCWTDLPAK